MYEKTAAIQTARKASCRKVEKAPRRLGGGGRWALICERKLSPNRARGKGPGGLVRLGQSRTTRDHATQRARTTVMLSGPPFSFARVMSRDAAVLRSGEVLTVSTTSSSPTGPDRPSEQST